LTKLSSSLVSAIFATRSAPIVEEVPLAGVAEQKLPNPCVGYTATGSGRSPARRRTERYWARVSATV
jgi:hypothetical protein